MLRSNKILAIGLWHYFVQKNLVTWENTCCKCKYSVLPYCRDKRVYILHQYWSELLSNPVMIRRRQ